jgi:adenosylcobinamide-GDP ribazoletransferase
MPILPRSAVLVVTWIAITGGLHLDGVIDTADGLGVTDPKRRLSVMAESTTGAFGVLAAVSLLLLKLAALTELNTLRWLILLLVPAWGRWSQQVAIARYPYLKRMGKGAFHKEAIRNLWYAMPSLFLLLGVSVLPIFYFPQSNFLALGLVLGGSAIAFLVPAWFNFKLGGQTGDTYGAVVEWTEAILLIVLTVLESHPW